MSSDEIKDKKINDLRKTIDMQMELIENLQNQVYNLSMDKKKLNEKIEKMKAKVQEDV